MSVNRNPESVTSAQGEVHPRVAPTEPATTKGHAPGTKVGNDAKPEFHAKTLPPGTAPSSNTFTPNTQNEIPGQAMNPNIAKETWTDAQSTITGATSADVNTGLGKPASGQTSQELHDGSHERAGLEGVGASRKDPIRERALDIDVPKGTRGKSAHPEDIPGAEERLPESAERVAAERD